MNNDAHVFEKAFEELNTEGYFKDFEERVQRVETPVTGLFRVPEIIARVSNSLPKVEKDSNLSRILVYGIRVGSKNRNRLEKLNMSEFRKFEKLVAGKQ